jgi:MoxR-like ATPase
MSQIIAPNSDSKINHWLQRSANSSSSEQVNLMALLARANGDDRRLKELGYDSPTALRLQLEMDQASFDTFSNLGRLYFRRLRTPIELIRKLGFARAKALQPAIEKLLDDDNRQAAERLTHYCVHVSLAKLETQDFFEALLDAAISGELPEITPPSSQQDANNHELIEEQERQTVLSTLAKQIYLGPKTRFPKRPDDFIVDPRVWLQLTMAANLPSNVLMIGPAGCGKTELVGKLAEATGRKLARFSFGAMSDPRSSIIGTMHFHPERGTVFSLSRFAKAIQVPKIIILLDELNRCDRDAMNLLIPLLDGQRYLSLDEAEESPIVNVADDVCFIASANVGAEYSGIRALDAAIRDRFGTQIAMDYPSAKVESHLLRVRFPGVSEAYAMQLVNIAKQQRRLAAEGEFETVVSTRMLLATGEKIHYGNSLADAIEFSLTNHFSGEGGVVSDRVRFRQLTQRYVGR